MAYGVGIIGIGFGQHVHVPAFRRNPQCEVRAIAATTAERAQAVAEKLGIPRASGDWREMVASPEIDIVSIAVPPREQAAIAEAAIAAGRHVFCEKPLALDAATADRIAQAANEAGRRHIMDFEFTTLPAWKRLHQTLADGQLGELRQAVLAWHLETRAHRDHLESWKTDRSQGGGPVGAFASHSLHYLEWLFGPIARLNAHTHSKDGGNLEVLALWHLEFQNGMQGSVSIGCNSFSGNGHRLEIYGSQGSAVLENKSPDYMHGFELRLSRREEPPWRILASDAGNPVPTDGRIDAVAEMVDRLVQAIESGRPAFPDLGAGARVQHLIDATCRSAQSGQWVEAL